MRFVHISDIHLGKLLYQQNLLEIQADLLNQVCDYLVDNEIDVLVMAGDIYDRSVPSNEAIDVLNDFLTKVILKYHKKVLTQYCYRLIFRRLIYYYRLETAL